MTSIWLPLLLVIAGVPGPLLGAPAQDGRKRQNQRQEQKAAQLLQSLQQADALVKQGRNSEAARLCEKMVRQAPDDARTWMMLATCHLDDRFVRRQDGRAEEACLKVIEISGRTLRILTSLCTARFRQAKFDEVLEHIAEIRRHPGYRNQRRHDMAQLHVYEARIRMRRQATDPGILEPCLEDLKLALTLDQNHVGALLTRGELLLNQRDYARAEADLKRVLALTPGAQVVHSFLATCYRHLRDKQRFQHHQQILSLLNRLTDSTTRQTSPQPAERREILRQLAVQNPADVARRLELAQLEYQMGDRVAARAVVDAILVDRPEHPQALGYLQFLQRQAAGDDRTDASKDAGHDSGNPQR